MLEEKNPEWLQILQRTNLKSRLREKASLKRFNTWRIGGCADCLIDVVSLLDLSYLINFINKHNIPWFILGKGSNLLIPDKSWTGIILHLSGDFKKWNSNKKLNSNSNKIEVFAGAALTDVTFVNRCFNHGLGGMEFLIGIPGTIGGAVSMNAGAHGAETSEFVKEVEWMDLNGNIHTSKIEKLKFKYRFSELNCNFGKIITSTIFYLEHNDPKIIKDKINKYQSFRMEKQPYNKPSCGSVFKNPPGEYAAKLIEESGLKGKIIGHAQVSPVHANFIVNRGEASSQDILNLIDLIRETVFKKFSINLELEVQILQSNIHK
tara:strand:- start:1146 stop:2105 length:960 start_codon:yes stop_codon:yes gene_type:complete